MFRLRRYVDGKLIYTSKPETDKTQLLKWMANYQADWSRYLEDAQIDPEALRGTNQGKEVTRVSDDELLVTTTEDRKLRFIIVESTR